MSDIGSKIAEFAYGKSDKVNSPQNQSEGFQRGFRDRMDDLASWTGDLIGLEWERIGRPMPLTEDFKEYKRGLWAATFQTLNRRRP